MKLGCANNQKFFLAIAIVVLVLIVALLDAFGFKVSEFIAGGIVGALGALTQFFFNKDQPKTDEAVGKAIEAATQGGPSSGS